MKTPLARLFWILILSWFLLRGLLLALAWTGDPDPAARVRVLKHFTEADIVAGESYQRLGFAAKVAAPFVMMIVMLGLMRRGSFLRLHERIVALSGGGFWVSGSLFVLAVLVFRWLLMLPFDFYLGHFCEVEAGFSTMTAGDWALRMGKGALVGWILTVLGSMLVLGVIRRLPSAWVWVLPFAVTGFNLVILALMPHVITPLFHVQKPIADGPLKTRILEIAKKADVPVAGIYEIDESRYSKHTNAYFTGFFGGKRIVLYDTLIQQSSLEEVALIFAHEVGHWRHDHMLKGVLMGLAALFLGCFALRRIYPWLREETSFDLGELHDPRNYPMFLVLYTVLFLWSAPVSSQISQAMETQADQASLELTGDAATFIASEVRLVRSNRSTLLPHPLRTFWIASHPPAPERIAHAEAFQK